MINFVKTRFLFKCEYLELQELFASLHSSVGVQLETDSLFN